MPIFTYIYVPFIEAKDQDSAKPGNSAGHWRFFVW